MLITNLHGLPDALVRAVKNDPYQGGGDISVTKLIDAPQRRTLYLKYRSAVVEDVSERIWSLLGQAVHTVLERAEKTGLSEKRMFHEIDGWVVSGQFDRLDLHDGILEDYKVTTTYKANGSVDWERQLNCLRWLCEHNGHTVKELRVVAIFRDWSKAKATRDSSYPQRPVGTISVPLWTMADAEAYVRERLSLHAASEAGESVPCSPEERWYEGTKYAVQKVGAKRAWRVYDSEEDVGVVPPGYELIKREGAYRRCAEYCEVAPFCAQWEKDQSVSEINDD